MPRWLILLHYCADMRRSLPVYAVLAFGVALSVFVLAWVLALRQGFVSTFAASGSADQALVLSRSASSEVSSFLRIEHAMALVQHDAIARGPDATPLASPELFSISYLEVGPGETASVTVRGLSPAGAGLRRKLHITQGRMFAPGTRELLVGRGLQRRWPALAVGHSIKLRGVAWTIVGSFDTGDASQSELWGDVDSVQNAFGLKGYQSLLARFATPADFERFRSALQRDNTVNAVALGEQEYYVKNSAQFPRAVGLIALLVGAVMACAAAVNASNSMLYLAERRRQVTAVVLAIGFKQRTVLAAMTAEASIVAASGALIGWLCAYLIFDGRSVSTVNMQSYEMVAFNYAIGWPQAQLGLVVACIAVLVGVIAVVAKITFTPIVRMLARE